MEIKQLDRLVKNDVASGNLPYEPPCINVLAFEEESYILAGSEKQKVTANPVTQGDWKPDELVTSDTEGGLDIED